MSKRIGIVGARGYVGGELIRLLAVHPQFELGFVSSREWAGERLAARIDGIASELCFAQLDPAAVASSGVDAVVLALPNGKAAPFVEAIDAAAPSMAVIDLSADYRFDPQWY